MMSTLLFEFRAFISVSVETGMINFNFAVRMINFNFAVRIPLNPTNHMQGDRKTETVIRLTGAAYVYQNTSQTKCTNGSRPSAGAVEGRDDQDWARHSVESLKTRLPTDTGPLWQGTKWALAHSHLRVGEAPGEYPSVCTGPYYRMQKKKKKKKCN